MVGKGGLTGRLGCAYRPSMSKAEVVFPFVLSGMKPHVRRGRRAKEKRIEAAKARTQVKKIAA